MEIEYQTIIFDIVGNFDLKTGKLVKLGRVLDYNKEDSDGAYLDYMGVFDESVVSVQGTSKSIESISRMYDFDRLQQERELVWCYRNGFFDAQFCANELLISVDAWKNVLNYHSDITDMEDHDSIK